MLLRRADAVEIPPDGHPNRWRILAILNLSLVMVVVAVSSLNVTIPTLQRALHAQASELQWIIDAYALVFAGLLLPAGALGDKFGRKGALQAGLVIFGAASVGGTMATTSGQLIVLRGIMGLGAALIMPATLSIITTVFPVQERAKAIAIWAGLAGAGGAVGPVLAGLLLKKFWWGSVFLLNVPFVVVLFTLSALWVPSSRDEGNAPLDPAGALLSIGSLATLLYAIIEGPERGWTDGLVLGCFATAAVLGVLFVRWEASRRHPMLDPRLFRLPGFGTGSLAITIIFFAMFGMFFLLTQYMQFVKGYSPLGASLRLLPAAMTMMVVAPRTPALAARFGQRRAVAVGMLTSSAGFVMMSFARPATSYWYILAGVVLMAAGTAATMPPSTTAIVSSLPPAKAGVGSAVNDTTRELGGSIGIALLGSLLSAVYRATVSLPDGPPQVTAAAKESIGAALFAAREAPPELAGQIAHAAGEAFTNGMRVAFLVAAAVLAMGSVVMSRRFPASVVVGQAGKP